ncbi:hypothetical protein LINGRAHAP2_LOCUS2102, partial [Linum grandiflorum]
MLKKHLKNESETRRKEERWIEREIPRESVVQLQLQLSSYKRRNVCGALRQDDIYADAGLLTRVSHDAHFL